MNFGLQYTTNANSGPDIHMVSFGRKRFDHSPIDMN
jgi:hypothetical protein